MAFWHIEAAVLILIIATCVGEYLDDSCPENCGLNLPKDEKICARGTNVCTTCTIGWWGDFCRQKCSDSCKVNSGCVKHNGECELCKIGLWGDQCDKRCPKNCALGGVCARTSGECLDCKKGWVGEICSERNLCAGVVCPDDGLACSREFCDPLTGKCDAHHLPLCGCGDGKRGFHEECERFHEGCAYDCKCRNGYAPSSNETEPACTRVCGTKQFDPTFEMCEWKLKRSQSSGCTKNCDCKIGTIPNGEGSCIKACGNHQWDLIEGEECDYSINPRCDSDCKCNKPYIPYNGECV